MGRNETEDPHPNPRRRRLYRLTEVAEALDVPLETVRAAVKAGDIRSFRIGRRELVPGPWFDRLLEDGGA